MFKNIKTKKYLIYIILIIVAILVINIHISFAKFVYNNTFSLNYNLVGEEFEESGLVNSDLSLKATRENLLNPYRGYYELDSPKVFSYDATNMEANEANKEEFIKHAKTAVEEILEENETLGLIVFYLNNYKEIKEIPEYILNSLNEYMDVYRQKGLKAIVRFAYGDTHIEGQEEINDPSDFSIILNHVGQLKNFFEVNMDVIHIVQLGFIGPWGEMHSSKYIGDEVGSIYLKQLVKKALEVVPYPIQISLRRPKYYRDYFDESSFFDESLGLSLDEHARIGLFNDAFVSSKSDMGTYKSEERESELEWQSYLTKYTIFGGEVDYKVPEDYVLEDNPYIAIKEAKRNMEMVHLNYLHDAYSSLFTYWQNQIVSESDDNYYYGMNALDYFGLKMGYRYLITSAKVPGYVVKKGGKVYFEIDIKNEGFGNLIHEGNVYVVLAKDGKYYRALTDKDPRKWESNDTVKERFVLKIPSNIEEGKWQIYLVLADKFDSYAKYENAYIKIANENAYLSQVKGNYIGSIDIGGESDNANNGFYQLNGTDTTILDNAVLYTFDRNITIDGQKTDEYEWYENELIFNNEVTSVYMRTDDNNLYILGKIEGYDLSQHNIHISIETINSGGDYTYMIENGSVYDGSYDGKVSVNSASKSKITYKKGEYFEYQIPKDRINISKVNDLIRIKLSYLDTAWDAVYKQEININ